MIALLLLAAGLSQRFKASCPFPAQHKLAIHLTPAKTILETSYDHIREVLAPQDIFIITNQQLPTIQTIAQRLPSPQIAIQTQGMGESIAKGLTFALSHNSDYRAVLILPADLPFIRPESFLTIMTALTAHRDHNIRPYYHQSAGHPVGFQQRYFPELCQLSQDQGAQSILQRYPVKPIHLTDPGIIEDIDTYEAFCRYRAVKNKIARR